MDETNTKLIGYGLFFWPCSFFGPCFVFFVFFFVSLVVFLRSWNGNSCQKVGMLFFGLKETEPLFTQFCCSIGV
jgi:hypothetical protein